MTRADSLVPVSLAEADWQAVHQAIDEVFDELAARIQRARPELTCRGERVQAARFQFNYRAFDPPADADEREPLVVGIRFDPETAGLRVSGDICTEESGRIIFDEDGERHVAQSASEVAAIASEIARRLAGHYNLILDYFASSPQ